MKRSTRPVSHGRAALVPMLIAVQLTATLAMAACGAANGSSSASSSGPSSGSASAPAPAPSSASSAVSIPVGSSTQSMTISGMQRSYRVYRPKSLPGSAPLVLMLHGALGTAQQAESSYGWDAQADAGHFVVAYPDGYKRSWAVSSGCCGPAAAGHVDDVAFITAVVKAISGALPIDQQRIYATGISNGGAMAYRLACDTDVFAAIGPDSTNLLGACPSPAPVSVIHIHGTADKTFPYNGGPGQHNNGGTGPDPADTTGRPIPQLIARWRRIDQCSPPVSSTSGAITTSAAACSDNRAVELITITGAGHQWPGQPGRRGPLAARLDPPFPGLNATATIWAFFRAHPKAR